MKQVFTLFAMGMLCLAVTNSNAQFSQNFDTNGSYYSNCWSFEGFFWATNSADVINGIGSLYTNPPTNNNGSGTRDIYTPYLNIASTTFSVSFKYKLSSSLNGQAVRSIEVGLLNRAGVFSSLDAITMNRNTPNLTQTNSYNKTFTLASTSVQRLVLKFSGSQGDGNTRMIVDDLLVSANANYGPASNCNTPPLAENNTYFAPIGTAPYTASSVLLNDSDPNGEALTASLATPSLDGTVVVNADGTFTFTPNPGFTRSFTSFTYTVTDGGYDQMTSTATVYIYFQEVTTLPLHLLDFSGTAGAKTGLAWRVASNEEGAYFEVQRSNDGSTYKAIATVFTTENTGNELYRMNDAAITSQTWYRLKIMNKDGSLFYSNSIYFNTAKTAASIILLQNPVQHTLRFSVPNATTISRIVVYNTAGMVVYAEKSSLQKGNNNISIALQANLPAGIYVLHVITPSGSNTTRFIKQ
jgi:hypothetical protein